MRAILVAALVALLLIGGWALLAAQRHASDLDGTHRRGVLSLIDQTS